MVGIVQVQLAEFFRGVPVVVMPGFEPTRFCENVERYKVTHVCVVPPILLVLLHHAGEYAVLSSEGCLLSNNSLVEFRHPVTRVYDERCRTAEHVAAESAVESAEEPWRGRGDHPRCEHSNLPYQNLIRSVQGMA